jgi:hypothetical protein
MPRLTVEEQRFAAKSIRAMLAGRNQLDGPQRLRNFIRVNYGVEYTLGYCRGIWTKAKRSRKP